MWLAWHNLTGQDLEWPDFDSIVAVVGWSALVGYMYNIRLADFEREANHKFGGSLIKILFLINLHVRVWIITPHDAKHQIELEK